MKPGITCNLVWSHLFVDLLENHSWAFSKWTLIAASVILVMGHPATGHLKTWRVGQEGPGSVVGALRTATAAGSPSTDELGSSTRSLKASVLLLSSSRPSSPIRPPPNSPTPTRPKWSFYEALGDARPWHWLLQIAGSIPSSISNIQKNNFII